MNFFFKTRVTVVFFLCLLLSLPFDSQKSYALDELPAASPRPFLTSTQYALLDEMLKTHLNYFLSSDAITSSGFPLGAYREGNRGQYNYSNPTEWGYAILAWIVAADRGIITVSNASSRIEKSLDTMIRLQNDPSQSYRSLFYPYYYVTTPSGVDLTTPYHDANVFIPSVDNGFLYTSLLIAQGWANVNGLGTIETKALSISKKMNFRIFLDAHKEYLKHVVDASNGKQGSSQWDVYADEGGMMAWIAYASDSITFDEYKNIVDVMKKSPRQWNNIIVKEAAWFNAMFTWGVRSLSGFPVAKWETGIENQYSNSSFANAVKAHLAFGNLRGVDYPAFSDAMTQPSGVGFYTPPNLPNEVPASVSANATPHAFFIPFNIGPDLDPLDINTLITKIGDLKNDTAHYYHNGSDGHKPFGFEVTTSIIKNNAAYTPPVARFIFETLSAAYTVLSIDQGLNIHDGKPTFLHYAAKNTGYFTKVQNALSYLYSSTGQIRRVPADYPTIQAAIDASTSGDTVLVAPGTYTENLNFNKSGVTLTGENQKSILNGLTTTANITASNLFGDIKARITGFTITGGSVAIRCLPTVSSLQIDNNILSRKGISLDDNAAAIIRNNTINDSEPIRGLGHNSIQIIGNTFGNTLGPLPPGISLTSSTGLIQDNLFKERWEGALKISDGSNLEIIRNRFSSCGSWDQGAGVTITNSTATLQNNVFISGRISNLGKGGALNANNSTVSLYNNVFYNTRGNAGATTQGVVTYAINSNITAKNNIFMQNTLGAQTIYAAGSGIQEYSYNDFWNNTTGQLATGISLATNNIYTDPRFIDTRDFQLNLSSPAVNGGDPDSRFNDLNATRNDMGIHGGPLGDIHDYILNLSQMPWRQNIAPYSSTGAATSQMIIDYMREGAGLPTKTQNEIYEYAKSPATLSGELNADQIAKALGHFDPYDTLVSNSYDVYDARPNGNPYQGYNFSVDSHVASPDAINAYMRNISHWIAFTVKQEQWWKDGPFVARPNTPAAVPLYGNYSHWVAIKGLAASNNPCPLPTTNPFYTPDFALFGFWMSDPLITGIGQDTYKTAAECRSTYFLPLDAPGDAYNGRYVQVAEPPNKISTATIKVMKPLTNNENLDFINANNPLLNTTTTAKLKAKKIKKRAWQDLVDKNFLTDTQAISAFENCEMGQVIRVTRPDIEKGDYYLVSYKKITNNKNNLTSAVIIISALDGSFKEVSWTKTPERFFDVNKTTAVELVKTQVIKNMLKNLSTLMRTLKQSDNEKRLNLLREYTQIMNDLKNPKATLIWEPHNPYSLTPYRPYWKITTNSSTWHVNQEKEVF